MFSTSTPPAARDIDHHHGAGFRAGKYNIGYWAWELPEFPDSWVHFADYFERVSGLPALCGRGHRAESAGARAHDAARHLLRPPAGRLPAEIRPAGGQACFSCFIYDLNSYSERKNPAAVLEAFRRSGLAGRGAALVIKVHNVDGNAADFAGLRAAAAALPDTILIAQTLARQEIYELRGGVRLLCFAAPLGGFRPRRGREHVSRQARHRDRLVRHGGVCHGDQRLPGALPAGAHSTEVTVPMATGARVWAAPDIDHAS